MDWITVQVLAVVFVATLVRSAFGFGEALVAVPLLALLIPVEVAVPLVTLVSITVALFVIVFDWQNIHVRSSAWLLFYTLFGIPVGLLLLTEVAQTLVKAILALIIITFSLYCLLRRRESEQKTDKLAGLFGFAAGVMGGAYGMNGPPLVVYGTLRGWTPQQFRATLQGYFLPASLLGMAGYWLAGLWVPAVTSYYIWSLPLVLTAIALGGFLNRRFDGRRFLVCIHGGLVAIGTVLLMQTLWM